VKSARCRRLISVVPIGNGFRFGRWYLHFAQAPRLSRLLLVTWLSDFSGDSTLRLAQPSSWHSWAIPWYVSLLLARLHAVTDVCRKRAAKPNQRTLRRRSSWQRASHICPADASAVYVRHGLEERCAMPVRLAWYTYQLVGDGRSSACFDSLLDIRRSNGRSQAEHAAFPLIRSSSAWWS